LSALCDECGNGIVKCVPLCLRRECIFIETASDLSTRKGTPNGGSKVNEIALFPAHADIVSAITVWYNAALPRVPSAQASA
jgi:hypothetical protein